MSNIQRQAIVIDPGTSLTKSGLASQDAPRSQFPTIIGKPKLPSIMVGMQHKDSYIGDEANEKQNILYLKHPIKRGFVQQSDWEDMTQILHHIYYSENRITPEQHPCLIAETPKNSLENRHKITEIMFQTLNVPQFYLANQSVLALFAAGKTTGLVVDCGAGVSTSVPIYQGYAIPHAIRKNQFAGNDIDHHLVDQLKNILKNNIKLNFSSDRQTIQGIKSRISCHSPNFKCQIPPFTYSLPDGNQIDISPIISECGQLLFNPSAYSYNCNPIHMLVQQTIQSCDKDIRKQLFQNIVISGGTSKLTSFGSTLQKELTGMYPSQSLQVHQKQHREFLPWIGGSILASLQTFQNMWVSKQEYLENGVAIVDKKCF